MFLYFVIASAFSFSSHSSSKIAQSTDSYHNLSIAEAVGKYVNNEYLANHKVSNDKFTAFSPGDQSSHSISLAFDGDYSTFWASSIVNTETVKNYLTFTFNDVTDIEAIIFGPAFSTNNNVTPKTRRYDGYPTVLKVYTATNDDQFELKYTFRGSPAPTDLWQNVQFAFPEAVSCNKLKLEFTEVTLDVSFGNDYTASCAELYFVSPDYDILEMAKASGNYDDVSYLNSNRIPKSKFNVETLGDQNNHPFSYALDGSTTTFWASSTVNTDTVKNTVTFDFTSLTCVEAIILHPAFSTNRNVNPNTRRYDGFPTILKVYSSSNNNDELKLHTLFSGIPEETDLWDRVQYVFKQPLYCTKLQIEFTEVTIDVSFGNDYTAACAELYLLAPPPPSQTPYATLTPTPTPSACTSDVPPNIIEVDQSDTTSNGRYDIEEEFHLIVLVQVNIANFSKISHADDGGAIRIVNAGVKCNKTTFEGCSSAKAGGAVYLSNSYDLANSISFEGIDFINNEAQYGGAIYIYSSSIKNIVSIIQSSFIGNLASAPEEPNSKSGGSAIFMSARKGKLVGNKFINNKGQGSALKLYSKFDKQSDSINLMNTENDQGHFVISNCQFEISKDSNSCIFYERGNDGALFELIACEFEGILSPGSHFIDGYSTSKDNSPKLVIKKCRFDSDLKNAFNIDPNNNFMSVDFDDQLFSSYSDEGKKSIKTWKILIAVVVPAAVAIVAIVLIIIVVKRRNPNIIEENEMSSMTRDLLVNDSLI